MQTLTYGRKRPDDGDKGTLFFQALEDNIDLDDAHSHNGTDSPKLTAQSITAVTQTILAAAWSSSGSGYRQLVTMPGTLTWDTHIVEFRDDSDDSKVFLDVTKVSANTYYVYINDSSKQLTAVYK